MLRNDKVLQVKSKILQYRKILESKSNYTKLYGYVWKCAKMYDILTAVMLSLEAKKMLVNVYESLMISATGGKTA